MVGQHRSVQRYRLRRKDADRWLSQRLQELARDNPRYGYRRMTHLLRREGHQVNVKRVQRVWRESGLQVRRKQRQRRRLGSGENSCDRHKAESVDHVWCYDFVSDRTEDGRALKMLTIIDEFTRRCLAIKVERSMKGGDVIQVLRELFDKHGAPGYLRSDNGSEFISRTVKGFLDDRAVKSLYIEPGSPWQNGYSESFNGTLGDELLKRELFLNLHEAKIVIEDWRLKYNTKRCSSPFRSEPLWLT